MSLRHHHHREEGASATLFVIALMALLGVALLALDAGSLFVSRRGQIADTDAGALAAASKLLEAPCDDVGAEQEADNYVQANDPTTTTVAVDIDRDVPLPCHPAGTVTVETSHPAQLYFGPLFGYDSIDTGVVSKTRFGQAQQMTGVRPIGICSQEPAYDAYSRYLAAKRTGVEGARAGYDGEVATNPDIEVRPEYSGAADYVFRITFSRTFPATSDCFGAPGNWAWLDFNGGPPSQPELEENIRSGYPEGVDLGEPLRGDEDCNTGDGVSSDLDCDAGPGSRRATQRAMDDITCPDCEIIYVVVYDGGNGETGTNAEFNLKSLVGLRVWGSDVGRGTPGHIDAEFVDEQVSGGLFGAFDPGSTAPLGTTVCGTGNFDNC